MRRLVDLYLEQVLTAGDEDLLDEICSPMFRFYSSVVPDGLDRGAFKDLLRNLHSAFPDLRAEATDVIEAADRAVALFRYSGTQAEPFMGQPVLGGSFDLEAVDVFRFDGEQIIEIRFFVDRLTMSQQLAAGEE